MSTGTDVNIEKLYRQAVQYLDDNYAYFLTDVLNIGSPSWTHMLPTAAVCVMEDMAKDDFEFVFNPSFAASLNAETMGFVLAHEAMHIVLYHLTLAQNGNFDNKQAFNIAADCCINDYLDSQGFDLIDGICRGEEVVGFNCANSTVTEVYDIIVNNEDIMNKLGLGDECPQCGGSRSGEGGGGGAQGDSQDDGSGDESDGDGGDEDGDGQGSGSGDPSDTHTHGGKQPCSCPPKFVVIDDHTWMHDPQKMRDFVDTMSKHGLTPDKLPDDLEEIQQETADTLRGAQVAGKGRAAAEKYMREENVTMKWVSLLKKVDPNILPESGMGPKPVTSFRTPRRKLTSMYPKVLVPNLETPEKGDLSRSNKKPAIVVALDVSGSIGDETANKFINLAKSIPQDKVKLFPCTFDDGYTPLDLDNPRWRGGGTNFSAIEDFIQDRVVGQIDGYPKAVVVVTDGHARFYGDRKPTKEQAKGWFWLLLDDYQKKNAITQLAKEYHFNPESFDTLDGYVNENINWSTYR